MHRDFLSDWSSSMATRLARVPLNRMKGRYSHTGVQDDGSQNECGAPEGILLLQMSDEVRRNELAHTGAGHEEAISSPETTCEVERDDEDAGGDHQARPHTCHNTTSIYQSLL